MQPYTSTPSQWRAASAVDARPIPSVLDTAFELRQTKRMRQAFAHDAVLSMERDADIRAPGGAITVALCGHWEHEPPCPLSPHHTSAIRDGSRVVLRTLFAVEPSAEAEVRHRIETALAKGLLVGPLDELTRWQVRSSQPSAVLPSEAEHARRLASN